MSLAAAIAALTVFSQTPPPAPPADPSLADLECASFMAVAIGLSGDNPDGARAMTTALMYYLGRLQVRDAAETWPTRIESLIRERGVDGLFTIADRCSAEISATGALIPAIGDGVMRAVAATPAAPPPAQ